jgi:hypothetical protein
MMPLIECSSANTNLPDDFNPQAPRVTMRQKQLSVHFSQLAAQLTIDIDNTNDKSFDVIRDSINKKINLFQNCVDKIISPKLQRERGLVLSISYPVDSAQFTNEAIFEYIQSNFFKIPPLGKPASAQFTAGYKTDDNFFVTLSVGQYQMLESKLPNTSATQWLDVATLDIIESGVELKIDVNSKPLVDMTDQRTDVTKIILEKTFNFTMNESDKFMGVQK